ncbi:hypothetical protein MWU38_13300 [Qipengyuania sp. S6317L1]|uniref:calcium-binding protein n=1 Tax=Qipengyuania sp. S6317L1 TaxID=2926410 RepID=UPI001FF4CC9F|nr:hypothetical protein [Qipengyuania sp. S6317L1]MCK0100359.1 hypothetical protein [Qipengyuania sp. S6317L1]
MGTFITEDFTVAENESLSFELNRDNNRASAFMVGDWNAVEGQVYYEPTVINYGELILLPTPGFNAGSFFQYNSGMSWEVATFENYGSILVDIPDMIWARVLTAPGGGSPEITNNGSITVLSGTRGNVFRGTYFEVTNGAQGTIYSEGDGSATVVEVYGGANVTNDGIIRVHVRGGTTFPEAEGSEAIRSSYGGLTINNSGLIEATATFDYQRAIAIKGTVNGAVSLINTGTIRAIDAIIHIDGGSFRDGIGSDIDNSGLIDGNVTLMERPDTVVNAGEIRGVIKLEGGDDVFDGSSGLVIGSISGGEGDDIIRSGTGSDLIIGGLGDDTLDGGDNIDTAMFAGTRADYSIIETAIGEWKVSGPDGTDTLTNVEILRFDDLEVQLDLGSGLAIDPANDDPNTFMINIRDFAGNDLGAGQHWMRIGAADANLDGSDEIIFVNRVNGRFAEVGVDDNGLVQFDNHGQGGDTRVVGIYLDPLVQSGDVEQGSPFDSQQRFQNDLIIGNIAQVLGSQDYDGDGFAEIYFALTDGTAYLRALMHADGNIQYANYQSEEQVIEYLAANGYGEETFGTWFDDEAETAAEQVAVSTADVTMAWQPQDSALAAEFFG